MHENPPDEEITPQITPKTNQNTNQQNCQQINPKTSKHHFHIISTLECTTTMQMAKEAVESGLSHGTVCRSHAQTRGRGRKPARSWYDDGKGALMFTIILERSRTVTGYPLTQCLALALCHWLEAYSISPSIKWPNDVRVGKKKIAGILVETHGKYFFAGMGVNLRKMNLQPHFNIPITSLQECLDEQNAAKIHRDMDDNLFDDLLMHIENALRVVPPISGIISRLESVGCTVEIHTGIGSHYKSLTGTLRGLGEDGALILGMPNGTSKAIYSGELQDI